MKLKCKIFNNIYSRFPVGHRLSSQSNIDLEELAKLAQELNITYDPAQLTNKVIQNEAVYLLHHAQFPLHELNDAFVKSGAEYPRSMASACIFCHSPPSAARMPILLQVNHFVGDSLLQGFKLISQAQSIESRRSEPIPVLARSRNLLRYDQLNSLFNVAMPPGLWYDRTTMLTELNETIIDALVKGYGEIAEFPALHNSAIIVAAFGKGAVSEADVAQTCFNPKVRQFGSYWIIITANCASDDPKDFEQAKRWADNLREQLRPFDCAVYANSIDESISVQDIYINSIARLSNLKSKYDPFNEFSSNHNIAPSRA